MRELPALADLTRRDGRRAIHLFACFLSVLVLTSAGFDTSEADYALAEHIIRRGSLAADVPLGPIYTRGPGGRYYASHELGNTLLMLPAVAVGHRLSFLAPAAVEDRTLVPRFIVSFLPCLSVALIGALLFLTLRWGFEIDERTASVTALVAIFGSTLWPYSRSLFEGVQGALWATAALAAACAVRATRGSAAALLCGLCLGMGLITRITAVLLVPTTLAYLAHAGWHRDRCWRGALRTVVPFLTGIAPFVTWQAYYNALRTGSPLVTPLALPRYQLNNALDGNVLIGLAGFLFSPGKSIFLYSPVLLLSVLGLSRFKRRHPPEFWFVVASVGIFVLLHARLRAWTGDWGWGPRHLVTVTPWMVLGAAWWLQPRAQDEGRRPARWHRRLTRLVVGAGLVVQLAAIATNWHYRYAFLSQTHRLGPEVIWSIKGSQLTDTLVAAGKNVGRLFGQPIPYDVVTAANPVNVRAANTLNVWWATARLLGVPGPLLGATVFALLLVAVALWTTYLRALRRGERRG